MKQVILIGSKPYKVFNCSTILDTFGSDNARFNLALPGNNNGTIIGEQYMNCHVYDNYIKHRGHPSKLRRYRSEFIPEYINSFSKKFQQKKYKAIRQRDGWLKPRSNSKLAKVGCPLRFSKHPRIGYAALVRNLISSGQVYVHGFSLAENDTNRCYYAMEHKKPHKNFHDYDMEIKILKWLHDNGHIDATLCFLLDAQEPTLDCRQMKPSVAMVKKLATLHGMCHVQNTPDDALKELRQAEGLTVRNNSNNGCTVVIAS